MTLAYQNKLDEITEYVISQAEALGVNHHKLAKDILANMKANY